MIDIMKMKKWLGFISIVTVIALLFTSCRGQATSGDADQKLVPLRVGVDSGTFSTGYRVADLKGFFKENGIDAQVTTFSFGGDTVNAILTGQVDVGVAFDFTLLARLNSKKVKILSRVQTCAPDVNKIVARDGITSPTQLSGKSFGVARGTIGEYATAMVINHYQLKDVNQVKLSSNADIVAALQRGDIKASLFSGTALKQALAVKGARVIGTLKDIDAKSLTSRGFIVASSDYAKKNPKALAKLLKSVNKAIDWTNKDKNRAADLLSKSLTTPKDSTLTELNGYTFTMGLSTDDVQSLKSINDFAAQHGLYSTNFQLADMIDTEPLKLAYPNKLTYKESELK
ncbi:MAG TPA: nitrate ABC transporter substrate-binding protein [Ruminococcaceae bacterium]|nr:nitrate ABC transporter substrate-binding protein [Oscillospiraceae bacterium]